ncbi:amidohydrolase family protein [Arenibacter sp. GZD96]|uniref:amidohydrolase family protein n=1 Tax=Aurantibrevibacter litoralis TaxID=3106030 RepID=UPI002AFEDA59|nr:amidohydrolase family protein [Arenibacter sp. GZD-96]MEA1786125.1 amidohydrolase family protein [Arenibacter sp. GZD-96]
MKTIAILFSFYLLSCTSKQATHYDTVITNVDIIDVTDGSVTKNTVFVRNGVIAVIAPEGTLKPYTATTIIEGVGKFLMPGLAEMHAHIPPPSVGAQRIEETLFLYLSNGVTTIRGMLGDPAHLILKEQAASGTLQSPRIFTSGPSLNGNSIPTPEEAIAKVKAYKKEGYDFLKIHPGIKKEAFDQLVQTANEVGITFAGHVPVDVGIRHALQSGYTSIDHVDGFLEGLVPPDAKVAADANGFFGYNFTDLADTLHIDALVQLSKKNKVWIVPTQSLFERWFAPVAAEELLQQPEMRYMPTTTLEDWKQRKNASIDPAAGFDADQWHRFNVIRRQLIRKLQKNGHGMLLGSDAPQLFNVPGFSIHHEIEGLSQAGMTPLEILRSGTLNPAVFFGMQDIFGSIKEGLDADMVLLNANPLENLKALKQIEGVMVRGTWLSKEKIADKLAEIAANAKNN